MVKDPVLSAQVYDLLYNGRKLPDLQFVNPKMDSIEIKPKPKEVNGERMDIVESINILKSKSFKTKEDKEKISMLEVILKNKS